MVAAAAPGAGERGADEKRVKCLCMCRDKWYRHKNPGEIDSSK